MLTVNLLVYNTDKANIAIQLKKYKDFVSENHAELLKYYKKLFFIKKRLDILPEGCDIENLDDYTIEEYPILLVGDCTQNWIKKDGTELNEKIKEFSYGAFYQGVNTRDFYIPEKTKGNKFIFK